jgi:hypothetical protein
LPSPSFVSHYCHVWLYSWYSLCCVSHVTRYCLATFQLGDHWLMGKMGFFDQSYHIPLVIRDPTRLSAPPEGQVTSEAEEEAEKEGRPAVNEGGGSSGGGREPSVFTESVDVFPTVMAWLGLHIPAQCDGASLLPLLQRGGQPLPPPQATASSIAGVVGIGDKRTAAVARGALSVAAAATGRQWRTAAHWEVNYSAWGQPKVGGQFLGQSIGLVSPDECYFCVLREKEYKLVYFMGGLPPLLFHIAEDEDELHDVSSASEHQQALFRLMGELHEWRIRHAGAETRALRRMKLNSKNQLVTRL